MTIGSVEKGIGYQVPDRPAQAAAGQSLFVACHFSVLV
jgi:hypothetical protein